MKPRKMTKTIKEQMERAKESRRAKSELRKAAREKAFQGMKVSVMAELYENRVPSVDTGKCSTFKNSMMNDRFKESAEVRAEIERKANCLAPAYNKGAIQFIGDVESARCAGRKNV